MMYDGPGVSEHLSFNRIFMLRWGGAEDGAGGGLPVNTPKTLVITNCTRARIVICRPKNPPRPPIPIRPIFTYDYPEKKTFVK